MSDDAFAALHPGVQYHLANTLRWNGLRPTQAAAVAPLLAGDDTLVIAPTAGGKTESAIFPLLSMMAEQDWQGLSVLYVCPLRALINNLGPRLDRYAQWLGRSAAIWHGDVSQADRQRILRTRPDILLTTPESLEAMLVSTKTQPHVLFSNLRAVVVDEVHAFAGDDRGWHLLAVLERLSRIAGRDLQRVGLSATVGNPGELLAWLQGSSGDRPRRVITPPTESVMQPPDLTVDYVASLPNAAKVITALHQGEKRLVFVDSRKRAEELGAHLRALGVNTFLSHSSLSAAERRRSEDAFADARDTVIVATSTLELGIDVGDLDRVIQVGPPRTVASFLQRLGRTGRRTGTVRNCLFLCIDDEALLPTLGMLECWSHGWVEPIVAPPAPRHIAAQQLMALCLQEGKLTASSREEWWGSLTVFDDAAPDIGEFLVTEGFFERDGDYLIIGPEAERLFGRRYFSDLTAVFSAPPEFAVLAGRIEVGTVGTDLLAEKTEGPRRLLLAGRSWTVTHIDWTRRRCFVEPADGGGEAKWSGASIGWSYELTRGMRAVLLGTEPDGVRLTGRALTALTELRATHGDAVADDRSIVTLPTEGNGHWWTWAGTAANRTLHATFPDLFDPRQRINEKSLRLRSSVSTADLSALQKATQLQLPAVDRNALMGLKFSAALPEQVALSTLAQRLGDPASACEALKELRRIVRS
ncbi:DEAD/DEAH box helicase [Nocardia fluminea]|uniref:DEAD/DEAH box helicase n=1 Tax=Nocardia fluminea TaxID=134984 RepID=UPI0033C58978